MYVRDSISVREGEGDESVSVDKRMESRAVNGNMFQNCPFV